MANFRDVLAQQAAKSATNSGPNPAIPDLKSAIPDSIPVDESDNDLLKRELAAAAREGYGGEILDADITDEEQGVSGRAPAPAPTPPKLQRKQRRPMTTQAKKVTPSAPPSVTEVTPEPEEVDEDSAMTPIGYLTSIEGAPSEVQIAAWKRQYKDLYMMPLEGAGVFVFRYLSNFEWKMQLQPQEKLMSDENALQEAVLQRCVLYPKYSPEAINTMQAGLPALMFEIIMKASYFIDASDAMMQVMRL